MKILVRDVEESRKETALIERGGRKRSSREESGSPLHFQGQSDPMQDNPNGKERCGESTEHH